MTASNTPQHLPCNSNWDHTPRDLDEERLANLKTLADFLWRLEEPERFEMDCFCQRPDADDWILPGDEEARACDTVCCALGWGPAAGILPKPENIDPWEGDYSWEDYMGQFVHPRDELNESHNLANFFFSSVWSDYDNTSQGAAQRIWYYLDYGFPWDQSWTLRNSLVAAARDFTLYKQQLNEHGQQQTTENPTES